MKLTVRFLGLARRCAAALLALMMPAAAVQAASQDAPATAPPATSLEQRVQRVRDALQQQQAAASGLDTAQGEGNPAAQWLNWNNWNNWNNWRNWANWLNR